MGYIEVLPILELSCIDLRNENVIAISDLSTYVSLPGSAYLAMQITPPGYPTINVPFQPLTVNIYKCADIGISCGSTACTPLPDGIYSIIYTVYPAPGQTFTTTILNQKFIKVDHIRCKYQNAFKKLKIDCICDNYAENKYWQELRRIKLYIDGSVVECNAGNYQKSFEYYTKANTMLDKLGCKYPKAKYNGSNIWTSCNC